MKILRYYHYFFNSLLAMSLAFVIYAIINSEKVNLFFSGKTNLILGWLFFLICGFVLKECLDYWFENRSKINLIKIIIELIGVVFFLHIFFYSLQ